MSKTHTQGNGFAGKALMVSGIVWFIAAVIGQWAFVYFLAVFYGPSTFTGQFELWNVKPLIDGYKPGDLEGNLMFAAHVLLAAVITAGGTLQLIPQLRNRARAFHRWNGRVFMVIAVVMALSGLYLTWIRGTYLSPVNAYAITGNGILILWFAAVAWYHAMHRRIDDHRRWAMRTFMVVNGVWFLRVGIMAWVILAQGPVGMTRNLDGPTDIVLLFGSYLIPLGALELYFLAQRSTRDTVRIATAAFVFVLTGVMCVGILGTVLFMWGPYL